MAAKRAGGRVCNRQQSNSINLAAGRHSDQAGTAISGIPEISLRIDGEPSGSRAHSRSGNDFLPDGAGRFIIGIGADRVCWGVSELEPLSTGLQASVLEPPICSFHCDVVPFRINAVEDPIGEADIEIFAFGRSWRR